MNPDVYATATFSIRTIQASDSKAVAAIIRSVMPEFGASGAGFAILDREVDDMFTAYTTARSTYFVIVQQGEIVGGGGIAPLNGATDDICELRKMYFLKHLRGIGLGQKLLDRCLRAARERSYKSCYLETLLSMTQACALYEKNGFMPLTKALGNTGHFGCDSWYLKEL